jgi:hypothetical protein
MRTLSIAFTPSSFERIWFTTLAYNISSIDVHTEMEMEMEMEMGLEIFINIKHFI